MRTRVSAAVTASVVTISVAMAWLALTPTIGRAAPKVAHRAHHAQPMPPPRAVRGAPDMSGGNAAAAGNNANSMSGSNSAGDNANGRSSGGFGGM